MGLLSEASSQDISEKFNLPTFLVGIHSQRKEFAPLGVNSFIEG